MRGPYGKPYPLKDFHGKEVYVIGGGVGLAPLRALLFALDHEIDHLKKVEVRFGARTPSDIAYKNAIPEWKKRKNTNIIISVDAAEPGWTGNVGLVTTILKDGDVDVKNAVAVVCGPPIMMKFVNSRLLSLGFAPQGHLFIHGKEHELRHRQMLPLQPGQIFCLQGRPGLYLGADKGYTGAMVTKKSICLFCSLGCGVAFRTGGKSDRA